MKDLRVFVLRFRERRSVEHAFELVSGERAVASCVIEPEHQRIRFLAPERAGAALLERVHAEGGLVWCSRHTLDSEPPPA